MKTNTMPAATGTQNGNTGDISILNRTTPVISGSGNLAYCDDLRRPRRDAPAALQLTENSVPGSQEPVADASRTFTIFHGFGANHSRSCPFQQSRNPVRFINPRRKIHSLLPFLSELRADNVS